MLVEDLSSRARSPVAPTLSGEASKPLSADVTARRAAGIRGKRIDPNSGEDVQFWTAHYGCTEEQLRTAIEAAGPLAQDVREFIAKQAKEALKHKE